jgi:two-component system nitrogen regulation response regulator GlnG
MDGTVLVADDDRTIRTVLTQALTRAGCKVQATSSLTTLLRWVSEGAGDVVITDVMMPDGNGLEMLPKIAEDRPDMPVIVISAQNTIMTTIKAAEAQAFDYLPKPFDLPDLMKRTAKALEVAGGRKSRKAAGPDAEPQELPLVGRSGAMQEVYKLIARVLNAQLPVIVTGESGTGKSLVARTIHDMSDRRARPFVTLSESVFARGAALADVLAEAGTGTVLFEDIAELPDAYQVKAVHLMDAAGKSGPRFMASSQVDLALAMAEGKLRNDLFYRLDGAVLALPPLRARVEDIGLLAEHFLSKTLASTNGANSFAPEALERMRRYNWPGNVRQLANTVERLALTGRTSQISESEVEAVLSTQPALAPSLGALSDEKLSESVARHLQRYFDLHGDALPAPGLYGRILREMEMPLIEIALDATGGNQAKCADLLGINRNTLRKKISELDISVTRRRKLM